jgi:release factor glutamine methyltransferase
VLLAHALDCRRIDLYARFEQVPGAEAVASFRDLVKRAADHEPFAYLVGEKEFYSLRFKVTPDVLIPRPETETLVEVALDHCRARGLDAPHLLDMGTGSGCIAVAMLAQLPVSTAVASDVSSEALAVARQNAESHGVADRVTFVQADRFDLPGDQSSPQMFDLILSNPPYVGEGEVPSLPANVRDHEPREALTDGADGLSFFRDFGERAADFLKPGGVLIVEVGAGQAARAIELIAASGRLVHTKTTKDRVVGHDRVITFALAEAASP